MIRKTFVKGPSIEVLFLEDSKVALQMSDRFSVAFKAMHPLEAQICTFLETYSQKTPSSLPFFPRQILPLFSQRALEELEKVPFGTAISYEELAIRAGSQRATRAVGSICGKNAYPLFIPCHRVLAKGGGLGGFAFGLEVKKALLSFEGIT